MSNQRRWWGLVLFIVVCLGAGGLGAMVTTPEIDGWYRTLNKPAWNPPNNVFGPVWTTLYFMMAIAAWQIWQQAGWKAAGGPLWLFVGQLLLNVLWSWLFFAMHQPGWAFAEIVLLWLAIAATTIQFFQKSRVAGWLMAPYLAWVTFAAGLNCAIWQLN
ncbi:MAG: tryptophan-rich sensory protein [Planctomycetaceae bacterium]|nr:tryptophan-rich sensory protein [Planctomycetaceae bacterium]